MIFSKQFVPRKKQQWNIKLSKAKSVLLFPLFFLCGAQLVVDIFQKVISEDTNHTKLPGLKNNTNDDVVCVMVREQLALDFKHLWFGSLQR